MTAHSRGLRAFASLAVVVMTCAGLASCSGSGGGSRPAGGTGGDELVIMPLPPSEGVADLLVDSPSVSDGNPAAGATFTLSAVVRNGGGDAEATTLRWYRSPDASITTSDTEVGTEELAGLAASASIDGSVDLTAPSDPGTYYFGACVDPVTDESDTANNCSSPVEVTVLATQQPSPGQPDLEVGLPLVSDTSLAAGTSFTLSATVRNTGDGASPATTLRWYRSADAAITTSDTAVGADDVGALPASGTSAESVALTAPSAPGTYYYGACVDAVLDESDATDNCSGSVAVTVPVPGRPELAVEAPSVSNSAPGAGTGFSLSVLVRNTGDDGSRATTLRYFMSTDPTITTSDTPVGTTAVAGLTASGSRGEAVDLTAPSAPGTYYYGACVDAVTDESDTTNNCSGSVAVTVPAPTRPDLAVGSPSVSNNAPETRAEFHLSATVLNLGDGDAAATEVRFYRSADTTITTADTEVGTKAVAELAASGRRSVTIALTAPSNPGPYYYGACVVAVAEESDASNNCSASVEVTVLETALQLTGEPDLQMGAPTVDDATPETGAGFTLSATVSNTGDGEAPATTLRYYRSSDATITTADTPVGTDAVAKLAASGRSAQSIDLTAPATAGAYYYGACVDAVTDESDTTDNCSASVRVDVVELVTQPQLSGSPDLEVGTPSVDDSAPVTGDSFRLSATVSNAGDAESPATTLRYYRSSGRDDHDRGHARWARTRWRSWRRRGGARSRST